MPHRAAGSGHRAPVLPLSKAAAGSAVVRPLGMVCLAASFLVGCGAEEAVPDGVWKVTVASVLDDDGRLSTDCVSEAPTYSETFEYELYVDDSGGSTVELKIAGESFATGQRQGCNLSYQSAVWLEDQSTGLLQWQIAGTATYQGSAGGCDLSDGLDWQGEEVLTVVESEDESVPSGCTYLMSAEGTLVSGG